jgi:NADH-quinone oxidoreductase subunit C
VIRLSSADTATADETPATDGAPAEDAPVTDERLQGLLDRITALVGDDIVESHVDAGHDLYIRVAPAAWKRTHKVLRDELSFKFFEFLSAIDWMPSPFGKSEDSSIDTGMPTIRPVDPSEMERGHAGGETRFQVFSRLRDISRGDLGITLKTDVHDGPDGETGTVETIVGIFPGADWHERETHEMFGIGFAGHPYLVNLYLPSGFEGHPLRKDFPLLARHVKPWPGIVDVEPMPDEAGDGDEDEGDES